jgi:hypothetical protein
MVKGTAQIACAQAGAGTVVCELRDPYDRIVAHGLGFRGRTQLAIDADGVQLVADRTEVRIPADPKRRMFQLRTVSAEVRAQVVFAAADPLTTQSLAMQLHMHASQSHRRSFPARYMLAGMVEEWPVRIESSDIISVASPSDAKNLTVLAADLTLRVVDVSHADAERRRGVDLVDVLARAEQVQLGVT